MTARVEPFGDCAFLIEVDDISEAHALAEAVNASQAAGRAPRGVEGAVTGFSSVVVHLGMSLDNPDVVERWLLDLVTNGETVAMARAARTKEERTGDVYRTFEIPVIFDGPDLEEVAAGSSHTATSVIDRLVDTELQVAFLGFAPGFPYLVGLPPELASVPRRPMPRTSVPAGSVAIGGGFAAIYPRATPGGWMLLGRTPVKLFDPDNPPYALLRAGDRVRFSKSRSGTHNPYPSSPESHPNDVPDGQFGPDGSHTPTTEPRAPLGARGGRFVEVLDPGLFSLVQDGGRRSVASIGVPGAGAADPESMRLANRLVGNPDGAAAIEITAVGPRLRFNGDAHLAVVASSANGADLLIDGRPAPADTVLPIRNDQVVSIGRINVGLRAYVAVAGGIEIPLVIASRSSDVLSGLGLGPLATGDQLDLGEPTRPHGLLSHPHELGPEPGPAVIRAIAGPHHFPRSDIDGLASRHWTVGHASNRIGIRLSSHDQSFAPDAPAVRSTAMVTGAIQIPPDGEPMILMPDHGTVGGYPVMGCVISADIARLGQLRPGDTLRFEFVDRHTAHSASLRRERIIAGSVSGWFPTEAGT